tara:strand:- start:1625 stop:1873 length:249 start_codon:yes stop_codon:yes gene_type:complete
MSLKRLANARVLCWFNILIAKKYYQMVALCLCDFCDRLIVNILCQIDTIDFRTNGTGNRFDRNFLKIHCLSFGTSIQQAHTT